jgi:hypothetical protein
MAGMISGRKCGTARPVRPASSPVARFDREHPDARLVPLPLQRCHARPGLLEVAGCPIANPAHDLWIAINGGKRQDVGVTPAPQHQPGCQQRDHPTIVPPRRR